MQLDQVIQLVQKNCDIVDASHAQDYGLCVYLLRMRDHYRWKNGIALTEEIANEKIKEWILDTEEVWERIEGDSFVNIILDNTVFNPFDADLINDQLIPAGYVYGGGVSYGGIPLFFLAELERVEERLGFEILTTDKEIARGLWGAPALVRGNRVIVRREALKQLLWSRYDEWEFNKPDNAMKRALGYYSFEKDPETAICQMTEVELETLIQHEIGEGVLGRELDKRWQEMLGAFLHTKMEHVLRAIKDLAADCKTTLPYLIANQREASLHLYFALFSDMRKELFPSLYLSYLNWNESRNYSGLENLVEKGKVHWFDIGKQVLELYAQQGPDAQPDIEGLLKKRVDHF